MPPGVANPVVVERVVVNAVIRAAVAATVQPRTPLVFEHHAVVHSRIEEVIADDILGGRQIEVVSTIVGLIYTSVARTITLHQHESAVAVIVFSYLDITMRVHSVVRSIVGITAAIGRRICPAGASRRPRLV